MGKISRVLATMVFIGVVAATALMISYGVVSLIADLAK